MAKPNTTAPCCPDWRPGIDKINAVIYFAGIHHGSYDGKPFRFCPWCGKKVVLDERLSAGARSILDQLRGPAFAGQMTLLVDDKDENEQRIYRWARELVEAGYATIRSLGIGHHVLKLKE